MLNLETEAAAQAAPSSFSEFDAIGASPADAFQVPEGFRADVLIGWDDEFQGEGGVTHRYGFNCDFLAFFPLPAGSGNPNEGLIFVNHEYPSPFFQHGQTNAANKTPEQIEIERESVGNAIVHVKRGGDGVWQVVSPSKYNRRITGKSPALEVTAR